MLSMWTAVRAERAIISTNKSTAKGKHAHKDKDKDTSRPSSPQPTLQGSPGGKSTFGLSFAKPKLKLLHPKLDLVFGEIMYSPYMTRPQDQYSKKMYRMNERLKDLKNYDIKIRDLPPAERPYEFKDIKAQFVKEVINFNPSYVLTSKAGVELTLEDEDILDHIAAGSALAGFTGGSIASADTSRRTIKSYVLTCAAARGGPGPFRRRLLKELKHRKTSASAESLNTDTDVLLQSLRKKNHSADDSADVSYPIVDDGDDNYEENDDFEEVDQYVEDSGFE
jgi:hypothetical protein